MRKIEKKKRENSHSLTIKVAIVSLFMLALVFNVYSFFFKEVVKHTGWDVSSTGFISLFIEGGPTLNLSSPLNITYNFSIAQPLLLDLNVSSDMPIATWNYRIYDNKHNDWFNNWTAFNPNININVARWSNTLYVVAYTPTDSIGRANVTYYVFVPNAAPIIYDLNASIQICENMSMFYPFYAIDVDEDENLAYPLLYQMNPQNPFFSDYNGNYRQRYNYSIYSGRLDKDDFLGVNTGSRSYLTNFSISDGNSSDFRITNITLIEKNNAPIIEDTSAKTVWTQGENSTLYEEIYVYDEEFWRGYWNLSMNISIKNSSGDSVNLFGVSFNGTLGVVNFTANPLIPLGGYDVLICVNDTGLTNQHSNISLVCGQNGNSNVICDYFSLAITDLNRRPTIIAHYPDNLTFNSSSVNPIYFNITKYDPDGGIPDGYWYVDGILRAYQEGNITDEFTHVFGCGVSGLHAVTAEISDGELNDSLTWNVTVELVACSTPGGSGGGGGGGSSLPSCISQWGCDSWATCQNYEVSLEKGVLSGDDYRVIRGACDIDGYDASTCGFQIRTCRDVRECVLSSLTQPSQIQYCYYTENPSCRDGLTNCHGDSCELLVDCGGPCNACATCTDKKKNQGEEGVDCGGPCPWRCVPSVPLLKRKELIYGFLILLLLLIILIIIKLIRVLRYKKTLTEQTRTN
ncbi:MAG TPA: hypothetical protein VJH92_03815 [Candidatus Nanoarchaeia archaeon]|nr:hypothetical protein [Candidatus Nanoarchaeia archaeon]